MHPDLVDKLPPALFKSLLRNLLSIGAGLSYHKEIRDLFTNVNDKILEVALSAGYGVVEVEAFFESLKVLLSDN